MATKKKAPASFNLLDHLEKEVKVQPFTAVIDAEGTEVTFPSPLDMNWREAEEFTTQMSAENASIGEVFSKWLSPEDFQKIEDADLTMGALMALAKAVGDHYGAVLGDPKA